MNKKIIACIVILYPVLDIIYALNKKIFESDLPINQAIRGMILVYLITLIKNRKQLVIITVLTVFLFSGEIYYQLANFENSSFIDDINYVFKVIFFVVAIFAMENAIERKIITAEEIIKYMILSTYIITLSILISPLGLGFRTYAGDRFGYKGLFDIQNGITATLLMVLPLCIYIYYFTSLKRYLINYLLVILSLPLIGTKSGLVGLVLILFFQFIQYFLITKWTTFKKIITGLAGLFIVVVLYLARGTISNYIDRQLYLLNNNWNGELYNFLLSNRNLQAQWVGDYIQGLNQNINPIFLFGLGYSSVNAVVHRGFEGFMSLEMDFYGILYNSGLWVLIFICMLIIIRAVASAILLIHSWKDPKYLALFLSLLVALVHSYWGGHVIYEALPSLYLACILALSKIKFKAAFPNGKYSHLVDLL